jgi:methanogenic corrinoid protein MtbC1
MTANLLAFSFLIFLTTAAGLSPVAAGSVLAIGRIWDAVNDPFIGYLSDKTRTRWGRRYPWIVLGAIPFGLTFFLTWIVPGWESDTARFWYYVVMSLLFQVFYTVVNLPYTTLTAELTKDYDERTELTAFRLGSSLFGAIAALGLGLVITNIIPDQRQRDALSDGIDRRLRSHLERYIACNAHRHQRRTRRITTTDNRALAQPANAATETNPTLGPYLEAIERLDMPRAEAILARASQLLGPRQVVHELVIPLLREVGERWHAGDLSIAQEHAVSAQVRAHLATLVRNTALPTGAPRMIFATPPGHRHEMGALMAAVLASSRGVSPVYLGPDVPFEELALACKRARAEVVVLSVLLEKSDPLERRREVKGLEALSQDVEVWLGAPAGHPALEASGIRPMNDFLAFEAALTHRHGSATMA